MGNKISCIVCNHELKNLEWDENVEVHPYDGLHFRTYGNYGSAIFDPVMEPAHLDVAICDLCIMTNLDKVRGNGVQSLRDNFDLYNNEALKNREIKND